MSTMRALNLFCEADAPTQKKLEFRKDSGGSQILIENPMPVRAFFEIQVMNLPFEVSFSKIEDGPGLAHLACAPEN